MAYGVRVPLDSHDIYFLSHPVRRRPPELWYLCFFLGYGFEGLVILSGQIIATSHDLTPNGGLVREITLFQGNLAW